MPTINITTEGSRVRASVTGSTIIMKGDVKGDLGLDNSTLERALTKLYNGSGSYDSAMFFGYSIEVSPNNDDIEIDEKSSILAVADDVLSNTSSVTGTYTTSLEHKVTQSMNVTWSSTNQYSAGIKIEGEFYIKGSGNMDFTTTVGKSLSKTRTETVSSSRTLSVPLRPGQSVNAILQVNKRNVTVTIPFEVKIKGHLAGVFSGKSPLTFSLKDVLRAAVKRSSYTTYATIEIECFTDGKVSLSDY